MSPEPNSTVLSCQLNHEAMLQEYWGVIEAQNCESKHKMLRPCKPHQTPLLVTKASSQTFTQILVVRI